MKRSLKHALMAAAALAALALGGSALAGAAGSSGGSSTGTSTSTTPAFPAGAAPGTAAHENAEKAVTGANAEKARAAAVASVPGKAGEVTTDCHNNGYEVTVTKSDGSQVTVHLDSSFKVMAGPGGHGGPPPGAGYGYGSGGNSGAYGSGGNSGASQIEEPGEAAPAV